MHFKLMLVGDDIYSQLDKFHEDKVENINEAKWDWFEIGGRYSNSISILGTLMPCNAAIKRDISNLDEIGFFAFLKDGVWTENDGGHADWNEKMKQLKHEIGDDELITIIDCHL